MAKRTIASKYADNDAAFGTERQLLSWPKDTKDICYEYDAPEIVPEAPTKSAEPAPKTEISTSSGTVTAQVQVPSQAPAAAAAAISDVPIPGVDIVHSLVAQKLKRGFDDVSVKVSIKSLVDGKNSSHSLRFISRVLFGAK